jgi:hypothetical protein
MEIESESLHSLSHLSLAELYDHIKSGVDEIEDRFRVATSEGIKEAIQTTLFALNSKIFTILNAVAFKGKPADNYTPFRANLLNLPKLLDQVVADVEDDNEKEFLRQKATKFAEKYWNACNFSHYCHSRIDLKACLQIHLRFSRLSKKEKSTGLGALLSNMNVKNIEKNKRQVFGYSIGGEKICKEFFILVHDTSRRTINRLQNCIKNSEEFSFKCKNNNFVEDEIYDSLEQYLTNKLRVWTLPNPNYDGPSYFLPSNFNWKTTFEFCKHFKDVTKLEREPMCWASFYKFYTNKFDACKNLTKKTDYCDTCCKFHVSLLAKLTEVEKQEIQQKLKDHLDLAANARLRYVDHSKLQQPDTYVCSFDYSENILVPHLIETPGIFFFKTRRKIDLFGITNESTDRQLNFLTDEPFKISKGPNSVISMLDYYIKRNIPEGFKLILYADNCAAQNKTLL